MMATEATSFELECLEERRHLAGTSFSPYEPATPGSQWVYDEVRDGVRGTSTTTIGNKTVRIHGVRAFQSIEDDSGGRSVTLMSRDRSGATVVHRITDSNTKITFNPALGFKKTPRLGQRAIIEGSLEAEMFSGRLRMKGDYRMEVKLMRREQVTVPAGTFSTVRIQTKVDFSAEYRKDGNRITLRVTGTSTSWLAKGVGSVKSSGSSHTVVTANEKREVEKSRFSCALRSWTIATPA
jgi:hypothetical protein